MRGARLLVLALLVVGMGAFIMLYERHQPTTDEAEERADRLFAELDPDAVTALEIRKLDGDLRIERGEEGWTIVKPIRFPADTSKVEGVLGALLTLEAERRMSTAEVAPADYGLAQPALEVVLVDQEGDRHALAVGSATALGDGRAVSRDSTEIALCPDTFTADLERQVDHWRSRTVIDVFSDQVASLEMESASGRIHAVQVKSSWTLLEPVRDIADREKMRILLADLNGQRIVEFVDDPEQQDALGLDPPAHRITLVRSEGRQPIVLELGATREQAGAIQVACRRNGSDLMWITDRALTALGRAPVLWRSAAVYPFDAWNVEEISFSDGRETLAAHKSGGLWQGDDDLEVDSDAILERISQLAALEAVDFDLVEPGSGEMGRIEVLLAMTGSDDEPTPVRYTFFRPVTAGGRAVVQVNARDTIMSVDPSAVEALLDSEALSPRTVAVEAEEPGT